MTDQKRNAEIVERIIVGARWATFLRLSGQLVSWACTIFVVRFISQEDYGLNAMLETPLEFLFLLSTIGLDSALVRIKSIEKDEIRAAFGFLLLLNGTLFLLYFFGSTLIATYFGEPRLEELAKILAFVFLFIPFRVIPNALLDRELKFKLRAFADLVTSIVTAIVTLALAMMGTGILALVFGVLTSRVVGTLILLIVQPWIVIPIFEFSRIKGLVSFGGIMTLAVAVATTGYMLPAILGGPTLGAEALGVFVVSWQFALLPLSKISPAINPIIFPAFSRFQGQRETIAIYMERSIGVASIILFPPIFGLASVSAEFVPTVLGDKWLPVILPLVLLCISVPFRGLTSFMRQVMGGIGYPSLSLVSTVITWFLVFSSTLSLLGFGFIGLACAILASESISHIATIYLLKKVVSTSYIRIFRALIPSITSSATMAVAVILVKCIFSEVTPLYLLILEVAIGCLTYLSVLRLFFRDQWNQTRRLIKP